MLTTLPHDVVFERDFLNAPCPSVAGDEFDPPVSEVLAARVVLLLSQRQLVHQKHNHPHTRPNLAQVAL